jgi:RNA polymerase sigma-70 factor, ECF subfamily
VITRQCYDGWREGYVTVDGFEAHRSHLRSVAFRMLGTLGEADDAVQEAWLRLAHTETNDIHNTRAWLTTVVARVCLDMLRSRKARHEVPLDTPLPAHSSDPEQEAMLADSVGLALLVVLETLTPAERLAFVLHDVFAVPFAEIAPIVGRSTQATKMLASRARHRVRAAEVADRDVATQRNVVDAFLAASRNGDFAALLNLLDPDVKVRADAAAAAPGTATRLRGASQVARQALAFSQRAKDAQSGFVNGGPAILVTPRGRLVTVITFTIASRKIVAIDVIADPERLGRLIIESDSLPGGIDHASRP